MLLLDMLSVFSVGMAELKIYQKDLVLQFANTQQKVLWFYVPV